MQKSKLAMVGAAGYKNFFPHCKDFTPPSSGPTAGPAAAQAQASQALAAQMQAGQKAFKKDASCLSDLDAADRTMTDAAMKSTSATSAAAQYRVMCLMLSGRCDEGEKLQRASLGQRKLADNIVDANIKSMRNDWCKK